MDSIDDSWYPQPGLDRLPDLISQVTKAGTPVRLRIDGTRSTLPPAVDLSAYRGCVPVELFGNQKFPPIRENRYFLSLGSYDFFWFLLEGRPEVPV